MILPPMDTQYNIKVIPIPAFKDNYIWLVINHDLQQVIVVDPGDADPVLSFLEKYHLKLAAIFVTHKHADHSAGIGGLLNVYPDVSVYASPVESIALATHSIGQDDIIELDKWSTSFKVIHIPGHTLGHVAFYTNSILFSGDTLFSAGCGRIFEGTAEQMLTSLNKLMTLPDHTQIYCGHEYTLANLNFALDVEPGNKDIQQRIKMVKQLLLNKKPSLPSTMNIEKMTNPFLRCTYKEVIERVQDHVNRKLISTLDVFRELRDWKNTL